MLRPRPGSLADTVPYILMLDRAQRFTASVRWETYPALADLKAANAMAAPEEGVRLRIPRTAL